MFCLFIPCLIISKRDIRLDGLLTRPFWRQGARDSRNGDCVIFSSRTVKIVFVAITISSTRIIIFHFSWLSFRRNSIDLSFFFRYETRTNPLRVSAIIVLPMALFEPRSERTWSCLSLSYGFIPKPSKHLCTRVRPDRTHALDSNITRYSFRFQTQAQQA